MILINNIFCLENDINIQFTISAQSTLVINQIMLNGTEDQKREYIPKLCRGNFFYIK